MEGDLIVPKVQTDYGIFFLNAYALLGYSQNQSRYPPFIYLKFK
jgi:hypothetical protein